MIMLRLNPVEKPINISKILAANLRSHWHYILSTLLKRFYSCVFYIRKCVLPLNKHSPTRWEKRHKVHEAINPQYTPFIIGIRKECRFSCLSKVLFHKWQ